MTDLELAAALRDAIALVRAAAPSDLPQSRAAIAELARVAAPPIPGIRPVVVRMPIHEPVQPPRPRAVADATVPATIEQRIACVLAEQPRPGETIDAAFRRKETDLGAAFSALAPLEARALQRRLGAPAANDDIAVQFARLTPERRARLLAFLGDARRREALKRGAA
jgi:hypothetical protein